MLFLTGTKGEVGISDALLLSIIGFAVVFFALIALVVVIKIISASTARKQGAQTPAGAEAPAAASPSGGTAAAQPARDTSGMIPAQGSLGEIDLHTVDDQTAALLMAIVADDLKVPLNTLRFTSIREI
ncbi:MAG: OadG family protein [Oscillospiraceae bacterium]|jgi:Na+-transporting methylmalonyl-CoA/oxaloacetate decarboxylase gamma subunit|nr:OadG family protein [Oscillospiraceae bacterium]